MSTVSLSMRTGSSYLKASSGKRIDFVNLPQNVLEEVFKLLDDRSLSQMRELSISQHLGSRYLEDYNDKRANEITLTFCCDGKSHSIFKIALAHAPTQISMTKFDILAGFNLHVTMKTIELEKFLAYMKPRTHGVQIKEIHFSCLRSEIIRMSSHFCEGRKCKVTIRERNGENPEYSEWLNFIQCVAPPKFNCIITVLNKDFIKFVLTVAEIVDDITLYVLNKSELRINSVYLIREILNRRCTELHICDVTHLLSQNDVETLLKIFHAMDKKVAFFGYAIPHHSNVVHSKIGSYKIEYSGYGGPRTGGIEISIKHSDFD